MSSGNDPVIVGVGFHQETDPDPSRCSEAVVSMAAAVRAAAVDAGRDDLFRHAQSIAVPHGLWRYRNPGRLVAEALGVTGAKSVLATVGVLQLAVVNDLCRRIAAGEQELGIVTGGEAQFRELRAMITQTKVTDTEEPENAPAPDVYQTSPDVFCADLEGERGLLSPAALFAVIESALRHRRGLGIEEHRDRLAELYASFSAVAAENPHAWKRELVPAAEIRDASPKNGMVAFPYTKRHCSSFNVNQSAAILVASRAKAERLGLDSARWIFPLAATESRHVVPMAQKRRLDSHPGTVVAGERAFALAGVDPGELDAAELYSCFPAAIQCFAADLRLGPDVPWTVSGAMPFAGGPFNDASLEGLARMVEVLRKDGGRRTGVVTNLSGIFGKQACLVLSTEPGDGFRFEDVTEAVAAIDPPVPLDGSYVGPATIAGYTVVYVGTEPSYAVAVCDTPAGTRTVLRSDDRELVGRAMREELCGRAVRALTDGSFSL